MNNNNKGNNKMSQERSTTAATVPPAPMDDEQPRSTTRTRRAAKKRKPAAENNDSATAATPSTATTITTTTTTATKKKKKKEFFFKREFITDELRTACWTKQQHKQAIEDEIFLRSVAALLGTKECYDHFAKKVEQEKGIIIKINGGGLQILLDKKKGGCELLDNYFFETATAPATSSNNNMTAQRILDAVTRRLSWESQLEGHDSENFTFILYPGGSPRQPWHVDFLDPEKFCAMNFSASRHIQCTQYYQPSSDDDDFDDDDFDNDDGGDRDDDVAIIQSLMKRSPLFSGAPTCLFDKIRQSKGAMKLIRAYYPLAFLRKEQLQSEEMAEPLAFWVVDGSVVHNAPATEPDSYRCVLFFSLYPKEMEKKLRYTGELQANRASFLYSLHSYLTEVTQEELDFLATTFRSVVVEEYKDGAEDETIPLDSFWSTLQKIAIADFKKVQNIINMYSSS